MTTEIYQGIIIYVENEILSVMYRLSNQRAIFDKESGLETTVYSRWFDNPVNRATITEEGQKKYKELERTLPGNPSAKFPEVKIDFPNSTK